MKQPKTVYFWHKSISTGKRYPADRFLYTEPETGALLQVERDEEYIALKLGQGKKLQHYFDHLRYSKQRRTYPYNSGVWMWWKFLLPGFPTSSIISLNEGQTDSFEVPLWLRKEIGLNNIVIKMEGQSPSQSFKDRGMPVAISDALRLQTDYPHLGIKGVCCASTGDTSAAAAAYTAYVRDKLSCHVHIPNGNISGAQAFQVEGYGANIYAIEHPDKFDACMKLASEFVMRHPELVLVNSKNDMRLVGQESIGLEILQDCNWKAPDWIAIPVGNGGNLSALMIALLRAKDHGLIDRLPGIIAAQSEKANPLYRWQKSGYTTFEPAPSQDTVASAMNINSPVSFPRIQKMCPWFDIHFMSVKEQDITDTWAQFMRGGANICPQTGVSLHGVLQARATGLVKENDKVVVINTAAAIKFSEAGARYHMEKGGKFANPYHVVEGNMTAIESAYQKQNQ